MDRSFKKIREVVWSRSTTQKEKGIYKKSLRWISIPFVKILLYTPLTANQVTFLSDLVLILSAIPFAIGSFWFYLLGVLMLYLGELGDYVDGPIARVKQQVSRLTCHYLTHFYHQGALSFVFIGLGYGVFQLTSNLLYLYAGFTASFFHLFTLYILEMKMALLLEYEYESFKKQHDASTAFVKGKLQTIAFKLFVFPVARMREIILIAVLLTLINPNTIAWLVLFYGAFLPFRGIIFFGYSYFNLKNFEKTSAQKLG